MYITGLLFSNMRTTRDHAITPAMGVHLLSFVTVAVVFLLVCFSHRVTACNVDDSPDKIIKFIHNEPGSYFGYTVQLHKSSYATWVLVGAPRGRSSTQPSIERPGALYRCQTAAPNNCYEVELDEFDGNEDSPQDRIVEIKDNQWLGVSLTRQSNKDKDADITVCGHLSKNDYYVRTDPSNRDSDRYVNGVCYSINADFDLSSVVKMRPCQDELQVNNSYNYHGYCQAGISATYSMDGNKLILGAVGSYESNGTTIDAVKEGNSYRYTFGDLTDWGTGTKYENEYIGYSVSTGNFLSMSTEQGVTGAPRSKEIGKVFIYDLETFQVHTELEGEMMNTYYGSAVLAVDLNNDRMSDLLVGAPLYSDNIDEGRVYVYINKGEGKMERSSFTLKGSNAIGGRFGSTIAYIKDVNLDGYNDVAIGAPYEDDNTGAVYIYRGGSTGIQRTYSQRLAARELLPGILSFGSSIAGGMDIDLNFYPELVVGSYANDSVYMFKTLPVVKLRVWITVSPETLDPDFNNCKLGGRKITCLTVSACFDYTDDSGLPDTIKFDYYLQADVIKSDMAASSRFFFQGDGGNQDTSVSATIELTKSVPTCYHNFVYLRTEARDFLTPLRFLLNYNIFDYPYEEPPRGDEVSYTFHGGLTPVLDNSICSNGTVEKTVLFIRDCGNDSLCQTDLKVSADLTVSSGNPYITLGGEGVVYLIAEIKNQGEEAHQAELLITHPREVVFESLESSNVECVRDGSGAIMPCIPDNVVTCQPREAMNETAEVFCSLGNPMRSRTTNVLRLRFDVGGMSWERRLVDFTMKATTLSIERNDSLHDNMATTSLPVRIVADIAVRGVVQPEQLFYFPDNETIDGKAPDKDALLRSALEAVGLIDPEGRSVNNKAIGPAFTHVYEVGNQGPGRLPFDSVITIQLPWRTVGGDWLIFIRNIQLNGEGSCDAARILEIQQMQMMNQYIDKSGSLTYMPEEAPPGKSNSNSDIGCNNAICVSITCNIKGPLLSGQGAFVNVDAVLWQRTLIDNKFGSVDLVSTVTVGLQDTDQPFTQPEGGMPDTIQLKTVVFTEEESAKPVEPWIIAVSTVGGVLGLIILIAALWKLGFFKRRDKDKLEQAMEHGL